MNRLSRVTEYFAFLLVCSLPVAASVTVSFPSPVYSDIGTGPDAEGVKNELARYLHTLDSRYLSAQDNLWIDVLDVTLAGERRFVNGREIRVMRGSADFPRIKLRYTLERAGKTTTGEDFLSDSAYLWMPSRYHTANISLPYEKRMLEEWFKERFAR